MDTLEQKEVNKMKLISLVVLVAVMAISLPAFAKDGNNVSDQLGDIFSGKGQTYAGVEIEKDFEIKGPLGLDAIGIMTWADAMVGELDDSVQRDVRGGARLRLVF